MHIELTISERAILHAIEHGVDTVEAIHRSTGGSRSWIGLNVDVLVKYGLVARNGERLRIA
jgi:predicted transcriptional regulator